MRFGVIKHKHVCRWNTNLSVGIDCQSWALGFQTHDWGWRFMLIFWHICWRNRE